MQIHFDGAHAKKNSHVCEICGRSFAWKGTFNMHVKRHMTESKDRPHVCPFEGCGKTFLARKDLQVHTNVHTGKKDYLCQHCGKGFSQRANYDRHILCKHTDNAARNFNCHICGKSFLTKSLLSQHLKSKTHGGPGWKQSNEKSKSSKRDGSQSEGDEADGEHSSLLIVPPTEAQ
jgi:uncharacterized Zn-finger protein